MIPDVVRRTAQGLLGAFLLTAGAAHLGPLRTEFRAQVPSWLPLPEDPVVVVSGLAEIGLGLLLVLTALPLLDRPWWLRLRVAVGLLAGTFLTVVVVGNVAQYVEGTDAFGLDSDRARLVRLFLQPPLVAWALWSTGAAGWLRERVRRRR